MLCRWLCILFLTTGAFAQSLVEQQTVVTESIPTSNLPALQIGPDDLLLVNVYQSPELSGTFRVGHNGYIILPMLGTPVKAVGVLPGELEKTISKTLQDAGLVVNPVVRVTIAEYQSRTVSVVGAVHKPSTFQAYGGITLLDAIAKSEGISEGAGDEIFITTPDSTGSPSLTQRIAIKDLMNGQSSLGNIELHGGEEIRVPEAGKISVVGQVKKPGLYVVHSDEATVLTLIAESEGLLPFASHFAYVFRPQATNQAKEEIPVELRKIMDRKMEDFRLKPGDILYVPDNRGKRLTAGALDRLLSFGSMASSAVIYAGVH